MTILDKLYAVKMPDGSKWAIRAEIVARNRAVYYADQFDGDVNRSLEEGTVPFFDSDPSQVSDWAKNNMNWSDVVEQATMIEPPDIDFEDGWVNGEASII